MMEKNKKRFVRTYSQGVVSTTEIWVDTQTGVNYLFQTSSNSDASEGAALDVSETSVRAIQCAAYVIAVARGPMSPELAA